MPRPRPSPPPAHHAPDGGFRNPWPHSTPPRFPAILRWGWDRLIHPRPPDRPPSAFPTGRPAFETPRAPDDRLTVTWIGHAATLIQAGGLNLLTDPMLGDRASPVRFAGPRRHVAPGVALEQLPPLDAVLLSHNHYDHLDLESVRALARRFPGTPWITAVGVARTLQDAGVGTVHELDWGETAAIGALQVTATPARHFSGRGPLDRNRSLWSGFAITGERHRVLFAGDTGYHPEFAAIAARHGPFDLALLPVGAYAPRWVMRAVHLNPEEAVQAFLDLGGRARGVMGAIHWGTFRLTDEPLDEPPRRTGTAWQAAGLPAERLWIPRHGETRDVQPTDA